MSHLAALFEGTDLSAEFKEKAEAIFQTAISEGVDAAKVEIEKALKEEYEAKIETRIQELEEGSNSYMTEEVVPTVNKYLTAAVNEWKTENIIAIQAGAKVDLAESFLAGLAGLAESHKLTLPEGQDQVVALQTQIDKLTEQAQTLIDTNIDLQKENVQFKKEQVLSTVTSTLSESQKEKFAGVSANVEFKTAEQYSTALKSLAESYFPTTQEKTEEEKLLEAAEQAKQKEQEELKNKQLTESQDPVMEAYLKGLRTALDKS